MSQPAAVNPHGLPEELKALCQWLVWRLETRNNEPTKVPYQSLNTQERAESNNPATWSTFSEAWAAYQADSTLDGIGFVFSQSDPYAGTDLDKCVDENGDIAPWALAIIERLDSYTEYSQSGKGLHIIVASDTLPAGGRKKGPIEAYPHGRYFCMTGNALRGYEYIFDRTKAFAEWHAETFPAKNAPKERAAQGTMFYSDSEIIEKCRKAANGPKFQALWAGNWDAYYTSQSEADAGLIGILSFYTQDESVLDELFRQSGLMRPKWDERHDGNGHTYGQMTIDAVLRQPRATYDPAYRSNGNGHYTNGTGGDHAKQSTSDALRPVTLSERIPLADRKLLERCLDNEEVGDADLFASLFNDRILFDHSRQRWLFWGEHSWVVDGTSQVHRVLVGQLKNQYLSFAAELAKEIQAEAAEPETAILKTGKTAKERYAQTLQRAKLLGTVRRVESVLRYAQKCMPATGSEWDSDPWLLGVKNGTIDLRTGAWREGQPQDRITLTAPTEWSGLLAACPRWKRFLMEVFNNDTEMVGFMQRLLGYGILGKNSEHILPILWGPNGRNGKDTLLGTIQFVLGGLAQPVSEDVLLGQGTRSAGAAQAHLLDLKGKRIVWVNESEKGAAFNAKQAKNLTGGGTIRARGLYEKEVTAFEQSWLLMLMTNYKPKADGDDGAFWERVVLVPFLMRFVENPQAENERQRDTSLKESLQTEASGILAWMVQGCLEWQEKGLMVPEAAKLATTEYRRSQSSVKDFVTACCIVEPRAAVSASLLYAAYEKWAEAHHYEVETGTSFGIQMTERFDKTRGTSGNVYRGIRIKEGM
jgi:putative DNA primase/helicase